MFNYNLSTNLPDNLPDMNLTVNSGKFMKNLRCPCTAEFFYFCNMASKQRLTVYGWIRENYDKQFLDDIINIIFIFYRIKLDTKILTQKEQESFYKFLFDSLKAQKMNQNMKSINTKLLFRASQHNYNSNAFHKYCDNQGPTITIIHNEHDYVYGGYANKSWFTSYSAKYMTDPNAFLFGIRPSIKYIPLKEKNKSGEFALATTSGYGPAFGRYGDIWIGEDCNIKKSSGTFPDTFQLTSAESGVVNLCGQTISASNFRIKEYEVFSVCIE